METKSSRTGSMEIGQALSAELGSPLSVPTIAEQGFSTDSVATKLPGFSLDKISRSESTVQISPRGGEKTGRKTLEEIA
eukprot:6868005-Prymnesium_polylepis.1